MRTQSPIRQLGVVAVRAGRYLEKPDEVATEEPLEIRACGPGQEPAAVAVTMRTPGHDFELAAGFLRTEGLQPPASRVAAVRYCDAASAEQKFNVVTVVYDRPFDAGPARRSFISNSSCGICGKATIDQVEITCPKLLPGPTVPASLIPTLPSRLREAQRIFHKTGGLHASGLFDSSGRLHLLREDVGRHNALDKLVGHLTLGHVVLPDPLVLVVSGRVSFEIVQKAAMGGMGLIAAVSAPSSLAVEAADRLGVTLAAFVRDDRYNVYTHRARIDLGS